MFEFGAIANMKYRLIVSLLLCLGFGYLQGAKADEPPVKPILQLEMASHLSTIRDCDVDPSNTLIATASQDKTLRIWELQTGKLLQTLRVPIAAASR